MGVNIQDAREPGSPYPPIFGKVTDYSPINYKKSPFVIYEKLFSENACKEIITKFEKGGYNHINNDFGNFFSISLKKNFFPEDYKFLEKIFNEVGADANKNFMLDLMNVENLYLCKFEKDQFINWHHDCEWWNNEKPYDNKLSLLLFLNDEDIVGGEIVEFHSTVPIPQKFLSQGSLCILPAYYFYKIAPITKGTKYILISHIIGPKFR
jgi:predicted 2-oxoglutarate/Fe(II)-dependent dioxygenase YbiX